MKRILQLITIILLVLCVSLSPSTGTASPDTATENWASPEFGPVTLTYANLSGQQVAVTGSWSQPGGVGACTGTAPCIGQFKDGTYDRSSRTVALSYFQPWNNISGQASLTLSSDGKILTGTWQHSTGARGSWSMNRPTASVLSESPAPPANADDLGTVWTMCEGLGAAGGSCIAGTWNRQGNSSSFAATWRNGAVAALTITKSGNRVTVTRTDSPSSVSAGLTGTYQGTLSGNSINDGTSSWRWANGDSASGWWKATVSGAIPPTPSPTATTVPPAVAPPSGQPKLTMQIDAPADVGPLQQITYSVQVANVGQAAANGIEFRFNPGELFVESASVVGAHECLSNLLGGWVCALGTIQPGDSANISILARAPDRQATVVLSGIASGTNCSYTSEPPCGVQGSASTRVFSQVDLKAAVVPLHYWQAAVGQRVTGRFGFSNKGTIPATGVTIILRAFLTRKTDPGEIEHLAAPTIEDDLDVLDTFFATAPFECTALRQGYVQCLAGALPPGHSVGAAIQVRPSRLGTLSFSASISSKEADNNPDNNHTGTTIKVVPLR